MALTKQELMVAMGFIQKADDSDLDFLVRVHNQTLAQTVAKNMATAPEATQAEQPAAQAAKAPTARKNTGNRGRGRRTTKPNEAPAQSAGGTQDAGIEFGFTVGQPVTYMKKRGNPIQGVVEKVTNKAVHFKGDDGESRRVAPNQLQPIANAGAAPAPAANANAGQEMAAA